MVTQIVEINPLELAAALARDAQPDETIPQLTRGASVVLRKSTAPNAEITVFPWKEPDELKQRTIDRVRRFLKAHVPMRAAAQ